MNKNKQTHQNDCIKGVGMKVLMLSTDKKIFEEGSDVRARMVQYGSLFDELHIVVFTRGNEREERIAPNVVAHPTNTRSKVLYIVKAYRFCADILKKNQNMMVTSQEGATSIVVFLLKLRFSFTFQAQVHTDFLSPHFHKESFKNFLRFFIQSISMKHADCVRVVSERIKHSVIQELKIPEEKITVLPIFTDAEKIQEAHPVVLPKKFDYTLLWIGRLEREKNCALAIDALSWLVDGGVDAGLVIVGKGSERKKCEKRVESLGLGELVIFTGWVDDALGYYKSADVLLSTSWYEGYGLNMVAGRIAGLSVVATDVGVAKEIGAHIVTHNAKGIAEVLRKVHTKELATQEQYEYPYKNKEEYLSLYKKSFEKCMTPHL